MKFLCIFSLSHFKHTRMLLNSIINHFAHDRDDSCLVAGCECDNEAAVAGEAARAEQEEPGAGDPELQGGGPETAQDHLPAREGARPIHQRGQRPHSEGMSCCDRYINEASDLTQKVCHTVTDTSTRPATSHRRYVIL